MGNTYLFYDIETSGLNPCFDQVMQFAAIRTDLKLNEIERHEILVKLCPDVIPSPDALAIHQVGLDDIANGANEWHAIEQIHALLNQAGTISVGYNTLGFDDEFLRFSFFRNLLPCYTHQYANQCSRMDLYPITALYYLFANDNLNWPIIDNRVSLKLENLNQANHLAAGQAHNAMVDVEATVALAKQFANNDTMWHYCLGYFNKATDLARLNKLPVAFDADQPYHHAVAVTGSLGYKNRFIAPVLHLGQHQHYKNQSLWLRLDTIDFNQLTPETLIEKSFVLKKRAAEPPIILPPKPRFCDRIDADRLKLSQCNQQYLHDHPEQLKALRQYHQQFTFDVIKSADTQSQLYQMDFPSKQDTQRQSKLHRQAPDQWQTTLDQFDQPIYRQLAERVLGRHFSNDQNDNQRNAFQHYLQQRYSDDNASIDFRQQAALSLTDAKQRCEELLNGELTERQRQILNDYMHYLTRKSSCEFATI